MKKLSTTKLHNFSSITTFVLVVSPFEVILKIPISNSRDSYITFVEKMNSNEKVFNYKVP
jgi:uncharacterized protein involved in tolerance to divalent cations